MDRPRITIFNAMSLDGSLDGFEPDEGLYYEVAPTIPHQAVLVGSGTLVTAAERTGVDLLVEDEPKDLGTGPPDRPLFVLVDSGGKITRFEWLRKQGHWGDFLVLVSNRTSPEHLERLTRLGIEYHRTGADQIDLQAALAYLRSRNIQQARVDAGSGLNGALVREALVDEIFALVAPVLAAQGTKAASHLIDRGPEKELKFKLADCRRLRDDHLLLVYQARA